VPHVARLRRGVERERRRAVLRGEADQDARHLAGIHAEGVLPSALVGIRRDRVSLQVGSGRHRHVALGGDDRIRLRERRSVLVGVELLAVEELELDQVEVDRVRIAGQVHHLPHLGGPERRHLGRSPVVVGHAVEQGAHRAGGSLELVQRHHPRDDRVVELRDAGEGRGHVASVGSVRGDHAEQHDLTDGLRIGAGPARIRRLGVVAQDELGARAVVGEVDHDLRALTGSDDEPRRRGLLGIVQDHRLGQVPAVGRDLHERGARLAGLPVGERQAVEARVRAVEDAEAVLAGLHLEVGPDLAVHHDDVAEELGHPDRPLGSLALVRVPELAVGREHPVLDREPDVVGPTRQPGRLVSRIGDDVEAGEPGVDVVSGVAEGVVVVPDGRRQLVVGVVEDFLLPVVALLGEAGSEPLHRRAVALRLGLAAVDVGHDRDAGRGRRPRYRGIEGIFKQVRANRQMVGPPDRDRHPLAHHDRRAGAAGRRLRGAVAVHGGGWELAVELLLDLPGAHFVVVRSRARHHPGDRKRVHVLGEGEWVQGGLCASRPCAHDRRGEERARQQGDEGPRAKRGVPVHVVLLARVPRAFRWDCVPRHASAPRRDRGSVVEECQLLIMPHPGGHEAALPSRPPSPANEERSGDQPLRSLPRSATRPGRPDPTCRRPSEC
jgi:hypothetical protein